MKMREKISVVSIDGQSSMYNLLLLASENKFKLSVQWRWQWQSLFSYNW